MSVAGRSGVVIRALRPHHWVKNLLVFVPAVLAHEILVPEVAGRSILAFIAFSLVASAGYLLNDLKDLEADRVHAVKRMRPLAAGELTINGAVYGAVALAIMGFALSAWLSPAFLAGLMAYAALTAAYSMGLKTWPLVDIFLLAGMYMLRVYGGGWATEIPISHWLASFSLFLFLSLGSVKRVAELQRLQPTAGTLRRRGYRSSDLPLLTGLGLGTGCVSVLIMVLYASSDQVKVLYGQPAGLWLTAVPILFWISWIWLATLRDDMDDDPIVFALRDPVSYLTVLLVALTLLLSGPLAMGL